MKLLPQASQTAHLCRSFLTASALSSAILSADNLPDLLKDETCDPLSFFDVPLVAVVLDDWELDLDCELELGLRHIEQRDTVTVAV